MAEQLTNIQLRVSAADKKKFAKVLDDVGLDIPTAFRIYMKIVINAGGIPFRIQKYAAADEQNILDMIKDFSLTSTKG